jgi:hypothetical protein
MTVFDFLVAVATSVIWMGAYAQLLGMPVAWVRLRKRPAWRKRPSGVRRIDLLAAFVLGPTALSVVWGWAVLAIAAIGGLGFSGGALLALLFGAPVIFVPWAVFRLDTERLPRLVEDASRRQEEKRARRGRGA